MLDQAGPVLDRGSKYETGIFKVVQYVGGPGLDRGPARSKAVRFASLKLFRENMNFFFPDCPTSFWCSSNECLFDTTHVCNGLKNCKDNSDERSCTGKLTFFSKCAYLHLRVLLKKDIIDF